MTTIHQVVTKVSFYIPGGFEAFTLVPFTLCVVTEGGWFGCKNGFKTQTYGDFCLKSFVFLQKFRFCDC